MTVVANVAAARHLRERRCIVSGEVKPDSDLIRFAVAPDGALVPDIAATLPGRGLWISATRSAFEEAGAKRLFAKFDGHADCRELLERTGRLLVQRMMADLGLARRSSQLVFGFDNVARLIERASAPVLVEARDGAPEGRRKLLALARAANHALKTIDCLESSEISLALGRENVVHAALKSGRLSERLVMDAGRLGGLRATQGELAGSTPATGTVND